ncbi:MAG: metallophosphoesterase [Phycisphaeraceae bacterium]
MRIAVIGDIHAYELRVHPRRLVGKRLFGQTNLWLNRRFRFNHALLEPVLQRAIEIEPDLLLMTGDLTTTSLPNEFADMVDQLRPLAQQVPTLVVPGNHDRYTFGAARQQRVENMMGSLVPPRFPHFEKLDEHWHLLALDAARPRVMLSSGRLGENQLNAAQKQIKHLSAHDGLIVLCHYPIGAPPGKMPVAWGHDLSDRAALARLLKACPARVVYVHGHIHRPWCWQPTDGKLPQFTFINAGAPCLTTASYPAGQGFWQIDLSPDPGKTIGITHHVPTASDADAAMGWKCVGGHPPPPADRTWHAATLR